MQPSSISGPDSTPAGGEAPAEALASLRRFARARAKAEPCELCGAEIPPGHPHLLDRASRQIVCSCHACALLFCGQQESRFLRIPSRILRLENFSFSDLQWQSMMLPIDLAFFVRQPDGGTRAIYPSPAGPMESLINLPPWNTLFSGHRGLADAAPEVEALLVNRIGEQPSCFLIPIDACYRLIGLVRTKWRGLSGGGQVWEAIRDFFSDLDQHATPTGEARHA